MTYGSTLECNSNGVPLECNAISEIASTWAVLVTMEELPATPERKQALLRTRQLFRHRLESAGLTESALASYLYESQNGDDKSTLRVIATPRPDD
jgi:hypothetical protein